MTRQLDAARERLLARLLAERGLSTAAAQAIPTRRPGAVIALTSAQRRLWFLDRIGANDSTYLVVGTYRLTGTVDVNRMVAALSTVLERHEALRGFVGEHDGEPVQLVAETVEPRWSFHDVRGTPEKLPELIATETARPLAVDSPPLLRVTLIRESPEQHRLILVAHHILCDDLSLGIVLGDLVASYGGAELPALPVQFADYACWLTGRGRSDETWWTTRLAGAPTILELPTDRPRPPVPSGHGRAVDCGRTDLSALAAETGCTPFMIMLAALGTVLGRFADVDDLLIGTAVTNRDAPELVDVVGMFVNTVVTRIDLSGEPTARELLAQVRVDCVDALAHADTPLERVIELVNPERDASYNPLFQTMLVVNPATAAGAPAGLVVEPAPAGSVPARFDLTLVATQGPDGVHAQLDYATDLFDESTAHRIAASFRRVLHTMINSPDTPIWEIPLTDPAPCSGGPATDTPPVLDLIDVQIRRTPDAPAVIAHDGTLTYRDLSTRADHLAQRLRDLGIAPGTVVGLALPAGATAITALLAILRTGAAYLPLDPTHPPDRLTSLLADAGAPAVITTAPHGAAFSCYPGHLIDPICPDFMIRSLSGNEGTRATPTDLAYLIYTSGSTGEPKAVGITHASLTNLAVTFTARHAFGPHDRILMVPPLSFDASVGDIFPALISGAALVLPAAPGSLTAQDLITACTQAQVTAIDAPSALWQLWTHDLATLPPPADNPPPRAAAGPADGGPELAAPSDLADRGLDGPEPGPAPAAVSPVLPASLRLMMVGGERVPVETVRAWARLTGGNVPVVNHYGPTEATVCATTFGTVDAAGLVGDLPIGRPLPGVRAYVLDRRQRPAPVGVAGELYLGGQGVARGYLGRPEATAERFVADPFAGEPGARMYRTGDRARYRPDGELEFLGRTDRQVKVRGNRIELGEVEAALGRHPEVREAVAIVAAGTLVAYVAADTSADLRGWVAKRLPAYMVPNSVEIMGSLPRTRHGKVDLKALPSPQRNRADFAPPRGTVQTRVAELWREVLGVDRVGADDDFFALGGHSLLIPKVLATIRSELGVSLPARAVLQSPRLADFAAAVERHATGTATEPVALPDITVLRAEAQLPPDIRVGPSEHTPGEVFFTGGTGMLGVRLLADVLRHSQVGVHCLVRARSEVDGSNRMREALAERGLWREEFEGRLHAVVGDLTVPGLGLEPRRRAELSERVGVIYHSAALINVLYPYGLLRPANVDGTVEVLRLAASGGRPKHVHFVSTLGVFFGAGFAGRTVTERDEPDDPSGIGSTFATSKWVADALVRRARERGVPATVYRLARVTGDGVTGESKVDDLFGRTLQTYVQVGAAPAGGELDISPIDYLARAIGALSRKSVDGAFHIRCGKPLAQKELAGAMADCGYPVEVLESAAFWERVGRGMEEQPDLGLAPFAGVRSLPTGADAPVFDCTATEAALAGLGLPHPTPDRALIRRYLDYFARVGFLPAGRSG